MLNVKPKNDFTFQAWSWRGEPEALVDLVKHMRPEINISVVRKDNEWKVQVSQYNIVETDVIIIDEGGYIHDVLDEEEFKKHYDIAEVE